MSVVDRRLATPPMSTRHELLLPVGMKITASTKNAYITNSGSNTGCHASIRCCCTALSVGRIVWSARSRIDSSSPSVPVCIVLVSLAGRGGRLLPWFVDIVLYARCAVGAEPAISKTPAWRKECDPCCSNLTVKQTSRVLPAFNTGRFQT